MKLFPVLAAAIFSVVIWLVVRLLLWSLHRQWWHIRTVRRALWYLPLSGLAAIGLWALGIWSEAVWLRDPAAMLSVIFVTLSLALLLALPFSGLSLSLERLVRWMLKLLRKPAGVVPVTDIPAVSPSRRSFITNASVVFPVVTLAGATGGLISAGSRVRLPEISLRFPNLPPALNGLRVLHVSDMHLGYYTHLDDLERLLRDAESLRPDLMLVTGDIADDVSILPETLRMLSGLRTTYGTYATLGNHEYFYDLPQVMRCFERGPVPLLRGTGTQITIGDARLYLAGADDPVTMRFDDELTRRLVKTVDESLNDAPDQMFKLLMSHRPEGFDVARERGVDLTLSGHTHGRQLGFNGRSIFEPLAPERYLWGHYQKGNSQLYTSAGVGHWFPFRLGCPPEAPVYVLRGER